MAEKGLVKACVSITTLDRNHARRMEPRAATPPRRLETIRRLADAGTPLAVLAEPLFPGLNVHEMRRGLGAALARGAVHARITLLRLLLEDKEHAMTAGRGRGG